MSNDNVWTVHQLYDWFFSGPTPGKFVFNKQIKILSELGHIYDIAIIEYEPETNTVWIKIQEEE